MNSSCKYKDKRMGRQPQELLDAARQLGPEFKYCPKCEEFHLLEKFSKNSANKSGYESWCKLCKRFDEIFRLYKVTKEQYYQTLVAQNHRCAICRLVFDAIVPRVDHDSETGQFRGLLCDACNTGIGKLQHDPTILRSAADYVERFQHVRTLFSTQGS